MKTLIAAAYFAVVGSVCVWGALQGYRPPAAMYSTIGGFFYLYAAILVFKFLLSGGESVTMIRSTPVKMAKWKRGISEPREVDVRKLTEQQYREFLRKTSETPESRPSDKPGFWDAP